MREVLPSSASTIFCTNALWSALAMASISRSLRPVSRISAVKVPTSRSIDRVASVTTCATRSTWLAALPVSSAAVVTPEMLPLTCWVPCAACSTLRAISWVAASCSSTAAAMEAEISLILPMVATIPSMAPTVPLISLLTASIWAAISSVALAVWLASDFTSPATTAKPLPASPARAASMVAFSARRLVWPAMALINSTTSPIFSAAAASPRTVA